MRIRFKPWARPELEASNFYRDNPEELKNKWIKYEFNLNLIPFCADFSLTSQKETDNIVGYNAEKRG